MINRLHGFALEIANYTGSCCFLECSHFSVAEVFSVLVNQKKKKKNLIKPGLFSSALLIQQMFLEGHLGHGAQLPWLGEGVVPGGLSHVQ